MQGWQWLFIIEGSVTVATTFLIVLCGINYPATAKWLSEEEREFAIQRLEEQQSGYTNEPASRREIIETFFGPRMLLHYITYVSIKLVFSIWNSRTNIFPQLTNVIVFQGLVYFKPTIVRGLGFSSVEAQLMTIAPWAASYMVAFLVAKSSDHFDARGYYSAAAAIVSGAAFLACCFLPANAYGKRYACLIVGCCGVFPSCGPLMSWVSCNSPSPRSVGYAVALTNSVSGIASIIGVWIWRSDEQDARFPTGNRVSAACSFITAVLAIILRFWYVIRMNKNNTPDATGTQYIWTL